MRPSRGQNLGHHVFLTDIALGDVLDGNAGGSGQRCRRLAYPVAQRRRKLRGIVENTNPTRLQKVGHPVGEACSRQRAGDDDPVIERQNADKPITVTIRHKPCHVPLHPAASCYLTSLVPAPPA